MTEQEYLDRLIDEKLAAEFLGYSVRALQNWRFQGRGPKFVKVSKRSVRYRRRDLIAWADQRTVSSTAETVPA
jgi:predicted DNA-binding transcriptional regulator AlpA